MFLEILTRAYKRPAMLAKNQASLQQQTSNDWTQTLLVDDVGRGIAWSYSNMAAYAPKLVGEYIWILDDDCLAVSPSLVAELKTVVEAYNPDVIMLKRDSGELGILPDGEYWQAAPTLGKIDAGCFVVRREIWQQHSHVMQNGHYASDYDFIAAVWGCEPSVCWYDCIASAAQQISSGKPEAQEYPPIVICSTSGKCFPVLAASIEHYVPEGVEIFWSCVEPIPITDTRHKWHIGTNEARSFGESYNNAVWWAMSHGHKSVIMANDDIVLRPDSYQLLIEDANYLYLYQNGHIPGIVGARCDRIGFGLQNIRTKANDDDVWTGLNWLSEHTIVQTFTIAPLFAWISAAAFSRCPFPPITIASDGVQCWDLVQLGYNNFVSRAYVHHVGGVSLQDIWDDAGNLRHREDYLWVRENRPELWKIDPKLEEKISAQIDKV